MRHFLENHSKILHAFSDKITKAFHFIAMAITDYKKVLHEIKSIFPKILEIIVENYDSILYQKSPPILHFSAVSERLKRSRATFEDIEKSGEQD